MSIMCQFQVENSMRITLAKFLNSAVSDNKELKAESAGSALMDEDKVTH